MGFSGNMMGKQRDFMGCFRGYNYNHHAAYSDQNAYININGHDEFNTRKG